MSLLELVQDKSLTRHFRPSWVVWDVEGILDRENEILLERLIVRSIDGNDLRLLWLLPMCPVVGIVMHELLQNLVGIGSFLLGDFRGARLKSVENLEFLLFSTFHPPIPKIGSLGRPIPAIDNPIDLFGLDEEVQKQKDHRITTQLALIYDLLSLGPLLDQQPQVSDPPNLRVYFQHPRVDDSEIVVNQNINLGFMPHPIAPAAEGDRDQWNLGRRNELHFHSSPDLVLDVLASVVQKLV